MEPTSLWRFENDGDNYVVLQVPSSATLPIVRVEVEANTAFDPLNLSQSVYCC